MSEDQERDRDRCQEFDRGKQGRFHRPDHCDADEEADHGAGEKQIAAQKTPPVDR